MRKLGQRRVYLNLRFNDKSHLGAVNIRSVRVVLELAMFVIFLSRVSIQSAILMLLWQIRPSVRLSVQCRYCG